MKNASKLSDRERDLIAVWRGERLSRREIGRRLGRDPSSISRELKRNRWAEGYVAIHAKLVSSKRKSLAGKRFPLKNRDVFREVMIKLRKGWSPELIAGWLKDQHPTDSRFRIHHETIYRYIYHPDQKKEQLWEYLPWGRPKRRKKHGRRVKRGQIPDRISIKLRPELVNERREFGHWEGDTVEGAGKRNGIRTEVERVSRFLLGKKVDAITSAETAKQQLELFAPLPAKARRSTTQDNGRENHDHRQLADRLGMQTYFADPYCSWQRGTNEFHNGLLRRYFPKGTDFATVSEEELRAVIEEINHRPRKCLGFKTPDQIFKEQLAIVAIEQRM